MKDSGRLMGGGMPSEACDTGSRPSGVDCTELFVPMWDGVDAGLFRDDALLIADAGVTVSGMEVIREGCFDSDRTNEGCGDGPLGRLGRASPLRTGELWSEAVKDDMVKKSWATGLS